MYFQNNTAYEIMNERMNHIVSQSVSQCSNN